ncbi:MAG: hypothetical protein IPK96_19155 [Flammeovirgaceae bacterium]|jgi:hypothetical protein|nr:hypothetical protein [Flammeovirgaceae bacterium]
MKSVIITPRNKDEFQFVTDLFISLNVADKKLSITDTENLGLAILMQESDRSKNVSEKIILRKSKS